jgi:hypothetical protein
VPRENDVLQFIDIAGNYSQTGMVSMRQKGITKVYWIQMFFTENHKIGGRERYNHSHEHNFGYDV